MPVEPTDTLPLKNALLLSNKLIIPLAVCLGGVGWRLRGDGALGGMSGMLFVGCLMSLLIYGVWRQNPRISLGMVSLLGLLLALTTRGYGTYIAQVTGRFASTGTGIPFEIAVPVYYGWLWLFFCGFAWVPLFAGLLGLMFSSHPFTARDIIVLVVVYYLVYLLGITILAHLLVPIISPVTTTFFQDAILDLGETPWSIYLNHFLTPGELEVIPGGRNYVSQINNFSGVLGSCGIILWLGVIKKNLPAARSTLIISLIFGFSMMIAGIWQFIGRGGVYIIGQGASFTPPEWLRRDGWSLWEFSTGALGCGFTTLYLYHQPEVSQDLNPILSPKWEILCQRLGGLALIALPCAMMVGDRLSGWFGWDFFIYLVEGVFILGFFIRVHQKRVFPNIWTLIIAILLVCVTFYILHFPNPEVQFARVVQWCVLIASIMAIILSYRIRHFQ